MLSYILRFGEPAPRPEVYTYLLVAAFDRNIQQMSVLMMGTPDPPNRYFYAGDKDEKAAIDEAAKSLLSQAGSPSVMELFALDASALKEHIAASDEDLARRHTDERS